jgi:hypothetical protein
MAFLYSTIAGKWRNGVTNETAADILEEAAATIRERRPLYGSPIGNHDTIAGLWTVYLRACGLLREGLWITASMVAVMMILVKVARMAISPLCKDHYLDTSAYSGIAYECLDSETQPKEAEQEQC